MTRAFVIADVHVHKHKPGSRILHGLQALRWAFDAARENRCACLVVAGDLFHAKNQLDLETLLGVQKIFQENARALELPPVLIAGNHDQYGYAMAATSAVGCRSVSLTDPQYYAISSADCFALPYRKPKDMPASFRKEDRFCIGHADLYGAPYTQTEFVQTGDDVRAFTERLQAFEAVVLGHYHIASQTILKSGTPVVYCGTPYAVDWSQAWTPTTPRNVKEYQRSLDKGLPCTLRGAFGGVLMDLDKGGLRFVENEHAAIFVKMTASEVLALNGSIPASWRGRKLMVRVTGKAEDRPGLQAALEALFEGEAVEHIETRLDEDGPDLPNPEDAVPAETTPLAVVQREAEKHGGLIQAYGPRYLEGVPDEDA